MSRVSVRVLVLVVALCVALLAPAAGTQPSDARAALVRLFTADQLSADWFAPEFLAAVPLARVAQVVSDLKREHGALQRMDEEGGAFTVVFERAIVPARIALDAAGRISTLFLGQPRVRLAGLDGAVQEIRGLPGRIGLLVLEDGRERAALNAEAPLAVGSAFKLAVLAALREQIASGRRSWRDTVDLRPEWKSLPSGLLQDWPDGSPLTLHTLAGLMISRSDNTAADALIHLLGREAVEAVAPARNRPFLTTREAFILKDPRNQDLLTRYRNGDEAARRTLLGDAQRRPLPAEGLFAGGPVALDVEWFYSVRELCAVMGRVADLPLVGINPGVARRPDWARIAFKGGSEPGVLNLTTLVEGANGRTFCVAVTWNDEARSSENRIMGLYAGMIDFLK